ncbi:hypothetical protein B0J11DRAFT_102033 [Dendryphion nanum]|uniref:DUF7514 domain-containing protein n=1 Tax=Dendryphion nanum TaxID=256645 RepID=A0A9P9DCV1_9PLEO|nr:hypothetical protein B0J11DRAFT_102033 [Dendryphion nanum]
MAAHDGYSYRSQPDHHAAYSSSYDSTYDPRSYHHSAHYQNSHHHDVPLRPRSRASSIAHSEGFPPQSTQQPLNNALNNAFDKSDSARAVDPELIAQITAEVKKSVLDEIKLSALASAAAQSNVSSTLPQDRVPLSPASTSASFPPRNVYTPPSPKHPDFSSRESASPDPLAHDPMFDAAEDTPTPRHGTTAPPSDAPQERTSRSRPPPVERMATSDFTPIEKQWQRLFDQDGNPLPRLGHFLRGLALHLIDDYEPKRSLVITPAKMLKFYEDVKLPEEIYPWQKIFGELSYSTLSKIYRDMRCEHHLIQEHVAEQPQTPALTPAGFEEWMAAMIQAYPDAEYARLSKAVLDMPISNSEDCKERFPKELPRRLFPNQENLQAQQRCAAALSAEGVGPLRRAPTFPPPPPMARGSQGSGTQPNLERERSPYATKSRPDRQDSRVFDSEDETNETLAMPIERERKPYSAAPGGGKVHSDDMGRSMHSDASSQDYRRRAQSTASQGQWVPPSNTPHSQQPHPRNISNANGRRARSPSFSNYGTRSDPNVRDIPGSYYNSNVYDSEEENRRYAKDAEKRRNDWARRQAEEETNHARRSTTGLSDSSYDSQPRSYDDDYYRGRNGTTANGYENRGHEPRRY